MINFSANATEGEPVSDEAYPDGQTARKVLQELPRYRQMAEEGTPFFLAVGIEKPHLPFVAPKKYWDLYDRDTLSLPEQQRLPKNAPALAGIDWGELRGYYDIPGGQEELSEAKARELIHGYYACVSYADALVGQLVAGLKANGLYDMRTDRYRYTRWVRWGNREMVAQELYDHRRDPQETVNVIDDPAYQTVTDSLSKAFDTNLVQAHQPGPARASTE